MNFFTISPPQVREQSPGVEMQSPLNFCFPLSAAGGQIPLAGRNLAALVDELVRRIHTALKLPLDMTGQPLF